MSIFRESWPAFKLVLVAFILLIVPSPHYASAGGVKRSVEVPQQVIGSGSFYIWVTYRDHNGHRMPEGWKPAETLVLTTEPAADLIEPGHLGPDNFTDGFAFKIICRHTGKLRVMLHTADGRLADSWIVTIHNGREEGPSRMPAPARSGSTLILPKGLSETFSSTRAPGAGNGYLLIRAEDFGDYRVSTSVRGDRKWIDLFFPSSSFIRPEVVSKGDNIVGDILIDRSSESGETQISVEVIPPMVEYNVTAGVDMLILEIEREE